MNIWKSVILGIVQGLTEFLPISSSGHLVIFQNLLQINESQLTFSIFLHFSSLLAIIIFFWPKLIKIRQKEIIAIVVGTIPAVIFGVLIKDYIELLFSSTKLVAVALMITGLFNFITDKKIEAQKRVKKDKVNCEAREGALGQNQVKISLKNIKPQQGLIIGFFQALAITPGISRSGSTLFGGILNKLDREEAFNFSFFLAIPAILGASVLEGLDLLENGINIENPLGFLLGGLAAFISGLFSLYLFKYVIKKAKLEYFAYYCFAVGGLAFLFL